MSLLSFAQSTVLAIGNMLFLGVQAENPLLYLLVYWIGGQVFAFIIYTLVVSFANLGKAIAVILLIVQVAGGGGAYPLAILPQFFQDVSVWLPATHVINAMRAAMFGVYQGDFWVEIGCVLLYVVPFALLGLVLRNPTMKLVNWFVEQVEKVESRIRNREGLRPSRCLFVARVVCGAQRGSIARMNKSENTQTNRMEDGGLPPRQRHMVLGIMMAGTTAACISQSMMIAALPTIMQEFLVGAGLAQLITTAYIFTLGLFSAMSAYLVSKKLDARRLFFIAMVGFIVGCCASLSRRIIRCCSHLAWCRRLARAFCSRYSSGGAFRYIPKANTARPWALWGSLSGSRPQSARQSRVFIVDAWGWRAVFVALGVVSAVVTLLAIPFCRM